MHISLNWLKKYIDLPKNISPLELGNKMTLHTVEIEGIENQNQGFDNIIIGKIEKIEKHPDADKLSLCKVDTGKGSSLDIVCGGSNLYEGMFCVVAKVGAKVKWHGEGGIIAIEKIKIRGQESNGMICAASEVGLSGIFGGKGAEVIDLAGMDVKVGDPIEKALELNDTIYELDNKSITHRPDLWGHYGLARDVAAFLGVDFKQENLPKIESTNETKISVKFDKPEICSRYIMFEMDNIEIKESPYWLKKALFGAGIRSINNIVDISNYVMLDQGHPLHVFDAGLADTKEIVIRYAKKGETITTIDAKERKLDSTMAVIASKKTPLLLGGVMGGKSTEVSDTTKRILLEVGTFDPVITRKTGVALGLRTDACIMYEKTLDPENCQRVASKFVSLVKELLPKAKVVSNVIDIKNKEYKVKPIPFSLEFLERRVGIKFDKNKVVDILERLGFDVAEKGDGWMVGIPSWRSTKDVSISEDLVEEVARAYGYDNIPVNMPASKITPPPYNAQRELMIKTRNIFTALGFNEVYNYTFVRQKELDLLGIFSDKHIRLTNPVNKDQEFVRRSLIPGLVQNIISNTRFENNLGFFELGKVFINEEKGIKADKAGKESLPLQDIYLSGAFMKEGIEKPFFEIKFFLEQYLKLLNINFEIIESKKENSWAHPLRSAEIKSGNDIIGSFAELHPYLQKDADLKHRVALFELNFTSLIELSGNLVDYKEVNKFPEVKHDICIVVPEKTKWKDVTGIVLKEGKGFVSNIDLFDVYKGKKLGNNKLSLGFHVAYQAKDRTLDAKEVESLEKNIIGSLERKLKAGLRGEGGQLTIREKRKR